MNRIEKQSEIKSPYFNSFVLQVIISTLPNTIIIVFLPLFFKFLDIKIAYLGVVFMLIRLISVLSSFLTPYFLKKFPAYKISSSAEALNLILVTIAIISIQHKSSFLFIFAISLKGLSIGTINSCRFSWLKALKNNNQSNKVLVAVNSISQSTYALAGILYLFFAEIKYALALLYIDAASSVIGFFLFMGLSKIPTITNYKKTEIKDFLYLLKKPFCYLSLIDFLFFFSLGGSNILLIKYGNMYLANWGGYGAALIIYGIFYFLGGLLINKHKNPLIYNTLLQKNIITVGILLGFFFIFINKYFDFAGILGMGLIFFFSPIFSLILQMKWFEISPVNKAPHLFATRTFCIQILGALGESIYGIIQNDIFIRGFLLLLLIVTAHYASRKLEYNIKSRRNSAASMDQQPQAGANKKL